MQQKTGEKDIIRALENQMMKNLYLVPEILVSKGKLNEKLGRKTCCKKEVIPDKY